MKKRVSIIICLILMCLVPFSACNESSAPPQNDTDSIISGDHENNTEIGGRTKTGRYRIVIQGRDEKFEAYFEVTE